MKKDILILGPSPFNPNINHAGGQLSAITNLLKYIDQHNISYEILDTFRSTFPPPTLKDKIVEGFRRYKELKKILEVSTYSGALVFGTSGLGYWEKLLFSLTIEKKGIKTLFFVRSGHFMESVIKQKFKVPLKKYLMNKISYIGYQGGKWKEFYISVGVEEHKLVKILNWIEIQEYTKEFTSDKVTFLYVGWMVEKKGIIELIDVILEHRDLDNYEFIFIGGGTLLDEYRAKIETLGITNIQLKGWMNSKDITSFYEKADALILPSHAEGFPNVILEALNYKLPVISTDVGGVAESVIDNSNGFLFEPKDKKRLYENIKKIGSSLALREEFSKNSEDILKRNHSIDINCKKIFDLF